MNGDFGGPAVVVHGPSEAFDLQSVTSNCGLVLAHALTMLQSVLQLWALYVTC